MKCEVLSVDIVMEVLIYRDCGGAISAMYTGTILEATPIPIPTIKRPVSNIINDLLPTSERMRNRERESCTHYIIWTKKDRYHAKAKTIDPAMKRIEASATTGLRPKRSPNGPPKRAPKMAPFTKKGINSECVK